MWKDKTIRPIITFLILTANSLLALTHSSELVTFYIFSVLKSHNPVIYLNRINKLGALFLLNNRLNWRISEHTYYVLLWSSCIIDYTICQQSCLVGWGCRIHWLHLCRRVRPPPPPMSALIMTLNNLMVRFQSTSSLPSLPGPLWPRMVATDRGLSMG